MPCVNLVHLNKFWPFPAQVMADILGISRRCYVIENNATGQLSHLIRAETGFEPNSKITKYDGRPFTSAYIAREVIKEAVAGCDGVLTVLVPWGVQQYSSGTAQAVLDYAQPGRHFTREELNER